MIEVNSPGLQEVVINLDNQFFYSMLCARAQSHKGLHAIPKLDHRKCILLYTDNNFLREIRIEI